jgi:hypothetical protein
MNERLASQPKDPSNQASNALPDRNAMHSFDMFGVARPTFYNLVIGHGHEPNNGTLFDEVMGATRKLTIPD